MMLSPAEREVALMLCRGLADKEVADRLCRSYHTVRTQKKAIYRKLGISKDTELLWYMILERLGRELDLRELREKGIELI
jgi:DNA-binding NarL/FixJ family response regulator